MHTASSVAYLALIRLLAVMVSGATLLAFGNTLGRVIGAGIFLAAAVLCARYVARRRDTSRRVAPSGRAPIEAGAM